MVIRNVWARLTRKQLLVLYPFTLGLLNTLAFLAVYLTAEDVVSWDGFARASFNRFEYLRDTLTLDAGPTVLATAAVAGVLVVLLSAAIRAPYFRAIVGLGYPLAPSGFYELMRLAVLYALIYALVGLLPLAFAPDSVAFQVVSVLVFIAAIAFLWADYVLVFEELNPLAAIRRSLAILERRLLIGLLIYTGSALVWIGIDALYSGYFEQGDSVFVLLPISYLLLDSFVMVVVDTLLIFVYFDASRT